MSNLVFTEINFRLIRLSTFERYYQLAQKIAVERIRSRRYETSVLIGITFYIGLLHLAFLWRRSTSLWLQVALFDLVSISKAVFHFDFIICSYLLLSTYVLYNLFFKPNTLFTRRWVTQIVSFEGELSQPSVWQLKCNGTNRISQANQWRSRVNGYYQHQVRVGSIHRNCLRALQFAQLNQASLWTFLFISHILVLDRIVTLQISDSLSFISFVLITLCSETHLLLYSIALNVSLYVGTLVVGCFMITTVLVCYSFDRINSLLAWNRQTNGQFRQSILYRFTITHTQIFLETLRVNRFISKLYFLFVLITFPVNALLLMTLLLGRINIHLLLFAVTTIIVTTSIQFGMHLTMVRYNRKIHWNSKPLLRLCATRQLDLKQNSLRAQLHMDHYISKFHTRNQYGIANGPLGVVTNQAVARKLFYYFRMFIFSYHIVSRV